MPTVNTSCIFDSMTLINGGVSSSANFVGVTVGQNAFMQFHLPTLEEINISSAMLYLFVETKGNGVSIVPTLLDADYSLEGAKDVVYNSLVKDGKIAEAADVYAPSGAYPNFNQWVSLDITELVIGYLGTRYYTIGLIGKSVSSGNRATTSFKTIEAGYAAYIQINYEYATPFKPRIIYPLGDAVSNTGTITFQWEYSSSGTAGQKKFDLQWKMQANTVWNTVSQTTSNTYYSMNANVFTNGIVEWRVRTYNLHNMYSEWGESQFVVIGKPGNPVISGVKNDAITEITWNANRAEESAARVRIMKSGTVVYDSGIIPGGIEDVHRPDVILENGNYVALLSISNMYDMWSNEISYPFTIGNNKPTISGFSVTGCGDFAKLTYAGTADAEYFIYRAEMDNEFVPIARTRKQEYEDYAVKANMRYRYFVRCYKLAYSDTAVKDVQIKYSGHYLSCVENMEKRVNLIFHDSELFLPFERRIKNDNALILYTGRKKPVKESGIFVSHTVSLEVLVNRRNAAIIAEIYSSNGIFCLRNTDMVLYCELGELGETAKLFNRNYLLNLTFEEVDYNEKVRFNE